MRTIELEQTCMCCPEQYWAHTGSKTIGYIRLRWGHLTCDYLPDSKPQLSDKDIRVVDHVFPNDEYKGAFDTEEERQHWLEQCKEALMKEFKKHKQH